MKGEDIFADLFVISMLSTMVYVILALITAIFHEKLNNKYHINIYKKKNKKYETKADPIYKIDRNNYHNEYRIVKWELKWEEWNKLSCILNISIYPISIFEWRYSNVGYATIGGENDLRMMYETLEITNSTIGNRYEETIAKSKALFEAELKKTQELAIIVKTCNKEFDDNYE